MNIFGATPTHPTFIELDNEPELWNSTHQEIQGSTAVTSDTYIANTITLTKALKDQFPHLIVFGPVHYGFEGIFNWQGESLSATPGGSNWFPDKYLPGYQRRFDHLRQTPRRCLRFPLVFRSHRRHNTHNKSYRCESDRRTGSSHRPKSAQPLGHHLRGKFLDLQRCSRRTHLHPRPLAKPHQRRKPRHENCHHRI